jgi:hypothetical protein
MSVLREGQMSGSREGRMSVLREGRMSGLREGRMSGPREGRMSVLREGQRMSGLVTLAACALLVAACTPAMQPPRCDRYDAASMGPENQFRVTIADGATTGLDGSPSRIDVAVASAVPLAGPVTLVQSSGGRELARWELTFPESAGLVRRCSLGFGASSCGATLTARPQTAGGDWRIEPGANRLLEASIAFRHCAGARDSAY